MDSAVRYQPLERQPGDLAAHAVEARQHDRGRRLVDDEVDPSEVLERADVAAVPADDPPLHLVVGQLDEPRRRLAGVRRREALHRHGEDAARPALRILLRLVLEPQQAETRLLARLRLDLLDQKLLGLGRAQTRDLLQLPPLYALGSLQLVSLLLDVALSVLQRLRSALELRDLNLDRLRLAQRMLLHPRDLRPPGAQLLRCTRIGLHLGGRRRWLDRRRGGVGWTLRGFAFGRLGTAVPAEGPQCA